MLKLITFDVTGTILKFRVPVGQQYAKIGSRYGLRIDSDTLSKNFKSNFKKMIKEHPNFGVSDIGWENWWRKLVQHTFLNSLPEGSMPDLNIISKVSSDLIETYKTKECWDLADGAECLLEKLISKNIKLGVISNYDPRLHDILKDLNVDKYFQFVISSYCVKHEKPNPEIFKIVEKMFKEVNKEDMLHIGDNPALDYVGAKNAGWNAILIGGNSAAVHDTDKDWTVKGLGDVYEMLHQKSML